MNKPEMKLGLRKHRNTGRIYRQETSFSFKLVYRTFYLLRQTGLKPKPVFTFIFVKLKPVHRTDQTPSRCGLTVWFVCVC
jgi:hypothetical protein